MWLVSFRGKGVTMTMLPFVVFWFCIDLTCVELFPFVYNWIVMFSVEY